MFKYIQLVLLSVLTLLCFAACGGGGGGGGGSDNSTATALTATSVTYTTATLQIDLVGTLPAGSSISGVNFTLYMPRELTPAMTGTTTVAAGVVIPSGTFVNAIQTDPLFTSSFITGTNSNMVITLADTSAAGVTQVGEIAKITLQISKNATPTTDSFTLTTNGVIDLAGNPIPTLKAVVSKVTLQ
jgi:hypothetical protein